jgi:archaellum component FlaG (FlaF/FlaG flagellin family)
MSNTNKIELSVKREKVGGENIYTLQIENKGSSNLIFDNQAASITVENVNTKEQFPISSSQDLTIVTPNKTLPIYLPIPSSKPGKYKVSITGANVAKREVEFYI